MAHRKQAHWSDESRRRRSLKPGLERLENRLTLSYTPFQIRAAYGINNISFGNITGDGTGQTIAIVDYYDDPNLVDSSAPGFSTSDLALFDQQFGMPDLPSFTFTKYNDSGTTGPLPEPEPKQDIQAGAMWTEEECLDVEWAHAIAPGASIDLIECNPSDSLYKAAKTAAGLPGVSVVSMSFASRDPTTGNTGEFSGEKNDDSEFTQPEVTFLASTGDYGSPGGYPAYSPNVVAVGGTSLQYLDANGDYPGTSFFGEIGWSSGGGGISQYEPEPKYQEGVQSTNWRTTPDVSFDADPNTGVWICDSYDYSIGITQSQFGDIGGTSLAAPCWAGLIAIADQGRVADGGTTLDGFNQTLPALYSLPSRDFHDIIWGSNGGYSAGSAYDEVTGLGTPVANLLVSDLAAYGMATQLAVAAQPPASVVAGDAFELQVSVEDSIGNLDTTFHGSVTLTLANNPGGGSLGGTLTVTAVDGVATFSGLTLDLAGSGYTLEATATGLTAATTNSFNVVPPRLRNWW